MSGSKPIVKIEHLSDEYDCELCGCDYASGAKVWLDRKLILSLEPIAHCYGGDSYDTNEIYQKILDKLGYELVEVHEEWD